MLGGVWVLAGRRCKLPGTVVSIMLCIGAVLRRRLRCCRGEDAAGRRTLGFPGGRGGERATAVSPEREVRSRCRQTDRMCRLIGDSFSSRERPVAYGDELQRERSCAASGDVSSTSDREGAARPITDRWCGGPARPRPPVPLVDPSASAGMQSHPLSCPGISGQYMWAEALLEAAAANGGWTPSYEPEMPPRGRADRVSPASRHPGT